MYRKHGIRLPRTSRQQFAATKRISSKNARPGDLVFMGSPVHHVGIYLGNGKMLAAPHTGAKVRIQSVYSDHTRYGRVGGVSPSSGSFGGGASGIDMKTLAEQYGYSSAFFRSSPELNSLIKKAVAGGWTADKFQARLRGTKWYRTHADGQRKWLALKTGDPATAAYRLKRSRYDLQREAARIGATLTAGDLKRMSEQANAFEWSDEQMQYAVASQIVYSKSGNYKGLAAKNVDTYKQVNGDYGVPYTDRGSYFAMKHILTGVSTMDTYIERARNAAKRLYPGLAKQIDAGQTTRELAAPYIDSYAKLLEVDANAVNFSQEKAIKSALQYKPIRMPTKESQDKNIGPMPLWQFEDTVRADPRWMKTDNAMDNTMQAATSLLSSFGLIA